MALTVQNLRAVGTGVEPASLLPGQIAFNVTDKILFVGDGSNFKTAFDGTQTPGVAGNGWYAMPMDFASLGDYYVANPGFYGDIPTDQQVLTWSTALNHPIWTSGGGGGGSQVYVTTNANVAAAPGATTSDKITAAIGVASPDEGDVTIVTGLPDDVYEGLYFFTTEWVKGAAYAYPSASEVIYNNTGRTLGATVQAAIDDLDDGLIATTAIANTANSTANSALSIASAALPRAGGTMTGTIVARNIDVQSGYSLSFAGGVSGSVSAISDSISLTSSTTAASSTAVRAAYNLAQAAVPRSTYTAAGDLVFGTGASAFVALPIGAPGQILAVDSGGNGIEWVADSEGDVTSVTGVAPITVDNTDAQNPIVGIDPATTAALGAVQVGSNIDVDLSGVISVKTSSTSQPGVVQLVDNTATSDSTKALTAAMGASLQTQLNGITISGTVTLAGSIDANTGLVSTVTTQGASAVPPFVPGAILPAPAAGNDNYYVIVTNPGTFTPTGSGTPVTSENGDWILSDGVAWQELAVGARPAYASTTTAGVIVLSTNTATQNGTDPLVAVTPVSLQSKVSDSTSTTSSFSIASSTAVKSAYDLAIAALPKTGGTMTGDITMSGVGVGVVFNDASTVEAISDSVSTTSSTTAASSTSVKSAYDAGIQGQTDAAAAQADADQALLDAAAAQATADAAVPCASFTALGELLAGTGTSTYSALSLGANGQFLAANSGTGTGLEWCTLSLACVPCSAYTSVGAILAGTGSGTYAAIPVGTSGQLLVPNSSCAAGVEWVTCTAISLLGYTNSGAPRNTAFGGSAGDSITSGTDNTTIGFNAGTALTGGLNNTLVGSCAGDALTTGGNNTVLGVCALGASTTGSNNLAIGYAALGYGAAGSGNTAVGLGAGANISSGTNNTLIAQNAGDGITTGSNNVAMGFNALNTVTTTSANVAIGSCSMCGATGGQNVAVGTNTLPITAGSNNVSIGHNTGCSNTAGSQNTLVGATAGASIVGTGSVTAVGFNAAGANAGVGSVAVGVDALGFGGAGSANTAVGQCAGRLLTGATNTLIGWSAGSAITTGSCNTVVGSFTGSTTLSCNVVLANGAGAVRFQSNQNGAWSPDGTNFGTIGQVLASNGTVAAPSWCTLSLACVPCAAFVACGDLLVGTGSATFTALPTGTDGQSLVVDTTCTATGGLKWVTQTQLCGYTDTAATLNTALGFQAGDSITTGTDNVFLGYNAGTAQVAGSQSVLIGSGAGQNTNAGGVTAIGFCAAQGNTSVGCGTYIGFVAGRNATGASNTYVGSLSGCAASNTSACGTLLGFCAGAALTSGNANTFLGFQSGRSATTGTFNVALGAASFQSGTGSCNIAIGCGALSGSASGTANVAIGHRAMLNASTAANNVAIGLESGVQLSSGSNNTFVGHLTGDTVTTGVQNTFLGACAGGVVATNSEGNTAVGFSALGQGVTSGGYNVAVGNSAGQSVTSGGGNTFVGFQSGAGVTTGIQNTILGRYGGTAALSNNVVLSDGAGTIRFQANSSGAWSPNGTNFGTAGQILVSAGTGAAPVWTSSGAAAANYGSFVRTTTQTNAGGASGNAVSYDTTSSANNFSIVSGSQITAAVAGTYQILASLQVQKTDAGSDDVNFWIKKNGVNEPNSAYNLTLQGSGAAQLGYINWVVTLAAGEYVELWWYSADANARLLTDPAVAPYPAVPSSGFIIHPMGA